jgi:ubiquinone/menaquinone biosynthesis C-methylase UbiE
MVKNIWDEFAMYYDAFLLKTKIYQSLATKMVESVSGCNKILDAGCGTGSIAIELAKQGKEVYGIDDNEAMLARAFDKVEEQFKEKIHLRLGDVCNLQYSDEFFDGVVSNNVIFYVGDPNKMLQELYRALAKKGILAISGPVRGVNYEKLIEFTIEDWKRQGVYNAESKRCLQGFIDVSMKLKGSGGIKNSYRATQLEELLTKTGFSRIIESSEDFYLGELYFVTAEK